MSSSLQIRFVTRKRNDLGGALEVVPAVDGQLLTDLVHAFEAARGMGPPKAYGGLVPEVFRFGPMDRHFVGAGSTTRREDGKTPLLGCECGEWGCWPLFATLTQSSAAVTWSAFEQPFRPERDYSEFGPFTFVADQYRAALVALLRELEASGHA